MWGRATPRRGAIRGGAFFDVAQKELYPPDFVQSWFQL